MLAIGLNKLGRNISPSLNPTQQWRSCYSRFAGEETEAQGPTNSPKVTQQAFVTTEFRFSVATCPESHLPLRAAGGRDTQRLLELLARGAFFPGFSIAGSLESAMVGMLT